MKKGPLSNKEKEYITKHSTEEVSELAKGIDRSESIVQKFIDTLEPPQEKGITSKLFARKEERGVTVMTESASMAGDESKDSREPNQTPSRYRKFIHKIKE